MCYNCGCHLPHNPMGKKPVREGGPSLVEEDMMLWAKEKGMTLDAVKDVVRNDIKGTGDKKFLTDDLLKRMADGWGMSQDEAKRNVLDLLSSDQK